MENQTEDWGYCIRIQALEGYLDKVGTMGTAYNWVAAIGHKGDKETPNPHYHIVIKTAILDRTLRARMRVLFDKGKGNEHMSIKKWDGDIKAVSYLFHEDPDAPLLISKGLGEDYIENARNLNKRILVEVAKSKGKAAWTLEEDTITELKKDGVKYAQLSKWDIARRMYLIALRNGKHPPTRWHCIGMCERIMFHFCDGKPDLENDLAQKFAAEVFPPR